MIPDRQTLQRICAPYGVRRLRVFGSVARSEDHPGSDLDLLVEFDRPVTLLQLVGLQQELEDALGHAVDLLTPASISPHIRDQVLREARTIYERPAA